MALPFIRIYIGDVKKDTDLLSPAAFGSYMRLLMFHMHEAKTRGEVTLTIPQLCRIFGAASIEEANQLLQEIVNPQFEIVDYMTDGNKHTIVNRRMVRETKVSQARSEAGKKGAEATNAKFAGEFDAAKIQQTENFAEVVPDENLAGHSSFSNEEGVFNGPVTENDENAAFAAANDSANASAKDRQKCNSNNSNNNNNHTSLKEEEKTNSSSVFVGASVYIVPEMLAIFKKYKPKYLYEQEKDFPALRKMAQIIAENEGVQITTKDGVAKVKTTWDAIVSFIQTDKLFKDYQLSQVERYFQAITNKLSSSLEVPQADQGKKSPVKENMNTANDARTLLRRKQQQTQEHEN